MLQGTPSRTAIAAATMRAARGEPWISYLAPEELRLRLAGLGFRSVLHLSATAAVPYYVGQPAGITPLDAWELLAATN
jgi:hypothetical protein